MVLGNKPIRFVSRVSPVYHCHTSLSKPGVLTFGASVLGTGEKRVVCQGGVTPVPGTRHPALIQRCTRQSEVPFTWQDDVLACSEHFT